MKELDKLLESTPIDVLLSLEFDDYSIEEKNYLYEKITEIADQKCYQVGIEYNIKDVELVEKLDEKLKLIELVLTLAYDSKTNMDDAFSQVRMWDAIIFNDLKAKNIVIPPNERHIKDEAYVGAYVKDPLIGLHRWVASFDLNSLYPSLIMQFNISPDKFIPPENYTDEMRQFLANNNINVDTLLSKSIDTSSLKSMGVTLSPNGQFFSVSQQGFLAKIMEDMYNGRTVYKKKAIEAKKQLEKETDTVKRYEIEKVISRYNNLQLAKKTTLNSAYGALGNQYFRFYDIRQATAITTSGQLAIRWIENKLNEYLNKLLNTQDKDYVIASDTDSVAGDTLIYLEDEQYTIKDIYDKFATEDNMIHQRDSMDFIHDVSSSEIYTKSVDKSVVISDRILKIMKHTVKKRLYRITVGDNTVVVTSDHSLIVRRNNCLISVKPNEIQENDTFIYINTTDTTQYLELSYNGQTTENDSDRKDEFLV